jgi:hypothetical protein
VKSCVFACVVAVAVWAAPANGQPAAKADRSTATPNREARLDVRIPQLIAYQGKLTDSTGRAVDDGSYVMVFSLSADSTGSSFWHETQTVETRGGLFNVLLGSSVPLSADAIPQSGCYLGIRVLPSTVEFRRQRFVSVPFAFQTENSDKLQGKDTTALDARYVGEGQANSVTTAMIEDTNVTMAKLQRAGAVAGQALAWSDSGWVPSSVNAVNADMVDGHHAGNDSGQVAVSNDTVCRHLNAGLLQGKDTTGFVRTGQADAVTSGMIVDGTIGRGDVAANFKAPYTDTADYAISAPASDSARVAGNSHLLQGKDTTALWNAKTLQGKDTAALWNAKTLQGKDTTGFVRTGQADAVTSAMIVNGTIVRDDVATTFKAPYSDTADYAIAAPAWDSARVAGNSYLLQGKDTTALWNAKTLQGKDTTGFVRAGQADAVTSGMIVNGTIVRNDVAANFKAPYADTADYAISAPASDSARVAGNSHLLQGKDTTLLWNAKTLQGKDTTALWNAKTLQGKDTTGFVRTGQPDAVTSAMIVNGTVVRADVAANFKSPYSDTADYAISAPASDSARVAGNSHLLQGKDTTALWVAKTLQGKDTTALWNAKTLQGKDTAALWNAKKLQGKDTTGFVRTGQADAVTSSMIVNGTIVRADVASNFKSPYSDTADYAIAAPTSDSARVAGNSHLLQGKDTTALWNAKTLQGKDTTGFVRTGQANSITTGMIATGEVQTSDIADANVTAAKIAVGAVDSTRIADGSVTGADIKDGTVTSADIAKSGVVAGTYGDGYHVARITVDSVGRLTSASDTTILGASPTGPAGGDLTGNYPDPSIAADKVTSGKILDGTIVRADVANSFKAPYSDTADYARAAPASDSARVAGNSHLLQNKDTTALWNAKTLQGKDTAALWNAKTLQGKDTTGFVRTGQADAVTSGMILNGTVVRADVASNFKAPYSDTADYAISAPASDSARVAGNSHLLQGKDTTGFVRTGQADAVTSGMIVNGTIARNDVATNFKAPYADTADYAISAPASDSARVAGNSHLLQGKDTTALWNAKTLEGKDTAALWNAKTLQGKDTAGFVRTGQADAVTSGMILDGTIVRADVATGFKAPYSDTADYAISAPASDSARVAGNSHLLQGKDTTGFVRTGQADAVTSAMIVNGTVVRADVASNFKAPYSDTADYAISAPASDSARVAGNSHLLQGKDTTALWNAKTLQGKDTTGFVNAGQANSITSGMITDGEVRTADIADTSVTMAKIARDGATSGQVIKWTGSAWAPADDSLGGGSGTVRKVMQATGVICSPNPIADSGTAGFDTTWGDARFVNEAQAAGADLTGTYPNPTIAAGAVTTTKIADANVTNAKLAASAVDSAKIADGSVTGADIKDGTVTSADIAASGVAAGTYGDGYHVARITVDSAGRLTAAKDTLILGSAPTGPAGGDLSGNYPNPSIASNAVTSSKIQNGTITRADVSNGFKAPYADTADYARAAPPADSARVAGNSYLLLGKDTTALWNAKTLQGKDTTGFVRTNQSNSVTSTMIVNGTITRTDVAADFKAPYSDTADYAISAPASDSARVAGNSHLLQGKDTSALWNAKTLQGKDTTGFVRTGQADAVTSGMIVNGTIVRNDVATNFKAPYADTADYAISAPASDSAQVAGNSHLLQGKDTTALWDAKTLQGNDTTALDARYVNDGQTAGGDLTGSYPSPTIAANAVNLSKIARGSTSGQAIIAQGSGSDPVWGYPSAVGAFGTPVSFIKSDTFSLDLDSIGANSIYQATVYIPGLLTGDRVFLSYPTTGDNWQYIQGLGNCQVTADDSLTFRVWNSSASAQDPGAATWRYMWIRPQ